MPARIQKRSLDITKEIIECVKNGEAVIYLCKKYSISTETFYRILKKKPELGAAYNAAKNDIHNHLVTKLWESKDPKSAMFLLERRFPNLYGRYKANEATLENLPDNVKDKLLDDNVSAADKIKYLTSEYIKANIPLYVVEKLVMLYKIQDPTLNVDANINLADFTNIPPNNRLTTNKK